MKRLLYILFPCFVYTFSSCTRDVAFPTNNTQLLQQGPDTIFPLSYLPIYPGSWWQYTHTSGSDTLYGLTSSTYLLNSWQDGSNPSGGVHKSYLPAYATFFGNPSFNNPNYIVDTFGCYVGYKQITFYGEVGNFNGINRPYIIRLDDTLPAGAIVEQSGGTGWFNQKKIFAKDTTVIINSVTYYPVIVVREEVGIYPNPNNIFYLYFYAKNVGLIRGMNINPINSSWNDTINLVSYFINQ